MTWLYARGAALPLVFGSFILTIVGMVMMSAAASKQSVGLSLVGYVVFASTFGLTASFGLANYDLPTINTAFIATAAITFVFGALGVTFPKFFQRVYGIGFGILLATILVEIVLMFMGVSQSITDLIVASRMPKQCHTHAGRTWGRSRPAHQRQR